MYWDQITPENEGKWGSVEGTRDQMNWSALDAIHNYAKQHNIPFKQHNFVWGSQQPGWIGGLSQADQRAEVEEWIRLFCERYPDTQLIDVVNEPPPHTTPSYMAALGGAGASGYDWIVQAFKWAHQYCPNAILILNDYNNIEYANDNSHTIDIVNAHQGGRRAHRRASAPRRTAAYNLSDEHGAEVHRQARHADRPARLHQRVRPQHRRRQPAEERHAEPVHDVLERRQRQGHHASGATSSGRPG